MDDFIFYVLAVASFTFGASIASFLNVVIYRVPRGESIVSPPSHCPKCGTPIKGYQNIPILAWLCLRGKCAACKAPISPRYILVETLGGCLFLASFLQQGLYLPLWASVIELLVTWTWLSLMIVGSMIDYDHKLLPDFVTVGGMILGLTYAAFKCALACWFLGGVSMVGVQTFLMSVAGLAFGFGLFALIRYVGSKAFKREAMGLGDVFLMGAVGALFGPVAVLFVLIFSSLFGSIIGCAMIALSKTKFGKFIEIPYGPYICLACLLWMFAGVDIIDWYLRLMRVG